MAIMEKIMRDRLRKELEKRMNALSQVLEGRDLKNAEEVAKKGHWRYPEKFCYIDSLETRLTIDTFKAILGEIRAAVK